MILGLLAVLSFLICSLAFVALVVTGGPLVWLATLVFFLWIARRLWRWALQETVPVIPQRCFPHETAATRRASRELARNDDRGDDVGGRSRCPPGDDALDAG